MKAHRFIAEASVICDRCGQKLNWDFFDHAKVISQKYKKE